MQRPASSKIQFFLLLSADDKTIHSPTTVNPSPPKLQILDLSLRPELHLQESFSLQRQCPCIRRCNEITKTIGQRALTLHDLLSQKSWIRECSKYNQVLLETVKVKNVIPLMRWSACQPMHWSTHYRHTTETSDNRANELADMWANTPPTRQSTHKRRTELNITENETVQNLL